MTHLSDSFSIYQFNSNAKVIKSLITWLINFIYAILQFFYISYQISTSFLKEKSFTRLIELVQIKQIAWA